MSLHVSAVRRRFCPGCTSLRCPSSLWVTGSPWCCTTGAACHVTASLPRLLSPPRVRLLSLHKTYCCLTPSLKVLYDARSSISTLHLSYHVNIWTTLNFRVYSHFFSTHNKWLNFKVPFFCCCDAFKSINCIKQRSTLQPKPCRSAALSTFEGSIGQRCVFLLSLPPIINI